MRDVQTLQQLPVAAATRNLQRATRNVATCNTEPKYPHRIHISHCPQSQHMSNSPVAVATNANELLPPPYPLSWRVANRLAYIFLNLPSSLFRFDQLDRPYLIAATCRHVVCLKDITIPGLCVCSGHKSSSNSNSNFSSNSSSNSSSKSPHPQPQPQPLSMHKSTDATRVIESAVKCRKRERKRQTERGRGRNRQ